MSDEELRAAIAAALRDDVFRCGRVWESWHYGTMTEADFSPAWEDDDVIDNIVAAVNVDRNALRDAARTALDALDEKAPLGTSFMRHLDKKIIRARNALRVMVEVK